MSQPRTPTIMVVIASLIAASAIFAGLALNAPQYSPQQFNSEKHLDNGLIAWIRFSRDSYNATDWVSASYEYINPTNSPINATLPKNYPIYTGYEEQTLFLTPYRLAHLRNITIPPKEAVPVFSFNCPVIAPGTYTVSLNGTYSAVVIHPTALVLRVVTDSARARAGWVGEEQPP